MTPWLWSGPAALGIGVAAHVVWFVACELLAPPAAHAKPAGAPGAATPRVASPPAAAPRIASTTTSTPVPGFVPTPVLAVIDEATDIKTFRLARPDGFEFLAGQFLAIRVLVDGKPLVRCYSISSSPDIRGYLEISVRRQGVVSTMLHASLRTGSRLSINRPAGQFVYPAGDDRPLGLLAGGIGITPLLSMLRHALSSDPTRPVTLLYSARDRRSVAFLSDLRVISERHPQVHIAITLSDDAEAPAAWRRGHIDAELLNKYVQHPSYTVFCICGPQPMMTAMETLLKGAGVPTDQIRSEQFSTAMAAASLNPPVERHVEVNIPVASDAGGGHRLRFVTSGLDSTVTGTQTLLEAAECEGVRIASSCRAGVCQACRTRLVEGNADCRSSVLDAEDRAAGFVLPCVTYALGDVVLEA